MVEQRVALKVEQLVVNSVGLMVDLKAESLAAYWAGNLAAHLVDRTVDRLVAPSAEKTAAMKAPQMVESWVANSAARKVVSMVALWGKWLAE